ncbi:hypothetical protein [Nostoc sp.]
MNKKSRNSLTDLLSEINLQELESEPTPKLKPERLFKQPQKSSQKSTPNLLDKLKTQKPEKITRITVDLDPETYERAVRTAYRIYRADESEAAQGFNSRNRKFTAKIAVKYYLI